MATTTSDQRTVRVSVTRAEMATLLGDKAIEAGFLDFIPESTEVVDNGTAGFEISFSSSVPVTPATPQP